MCSLTTHPLHHLPSATANYSSALLHPVTFFVFTQRREHGRLSFCPWLISLNTLSFCSIHIAQNFIPFMDVRDSNMYTYHILKDCLNPPINMWVGPTSGCHGGISANEGVPMSFQHSDFNSGWSMSYSKIAGPYGSSILNCWVWGGGVFSIFSNGCTCLHSDWWFILFSTSKGIFPLPLGSRHSVWGLIPGPVFLP